MKHIFSLLVGILIISFSYGQKAKVKQEKVYKMNYWIDAPVTAGLFVTYYFGLKSLHAKANPDSAQIAALNKSDVWWFDRVALYQDVSQMDNARNISDWGLRIAGFMPFLLFIDRKIRRDWYDIALLYLETQAVAQNSYILLGPLFTKRIRPFGYYTELPMASKTGNGTTDSWFSGHTSTTATASFFMAKVLSDYHPELGGKKWLLYGAAIIPPAIIGIYRIKALKHFPTDVIMGTAVGAAVGILIPHLHKITKKNKDLSIVPFAGSHTGVALSYKF
jgi:membrane-associated phospholipid phosphatase